jgi:DNA polymerase III sliding clamp (beta) subunit (PCNA family)
MDFETVLPMKTVSDIIKEVKETEETEETTGCDCGNCTCK